MNFLFSGLFWGVLIILIGLSIIVRVVFNIDVPVFKIVMGLILVYFGLQILVGSPFRFTGRMHRTGRIHRVNRASRSGIVINEDNEYNIIFSSGNIDLSDLQEPDTARTIEINVVFGSAVVWIASDVPVNIQYSTVFGETILPEGHTGYFGSDQVKLGGADADILRLNINTVFGSTEVKRKKPK